MLIECLDKFVIYVAGKTTSWISLILFPALLYCHLLDVELRHNVLPRQFRNLIYLSLPCYIFRFNVFLKKSLHISF